MGKSSGKSKTKWTKVVLEDNPTVKTTTSNMSSRNQGNTSGGWSRNSSNRDEMRSSYGNRGDDTTRDWSRNSSNREEMQSSFGNRGNDTRDWSRNSSNREEMQSSFGNRGNDSREWSRNSSSRDEMGSSSFGNRDNNWSRNSSNRDEMGSSTYGNRGNGSREWSRNSSNREETGSSSYRNRDNDSRESSDANPESSQPWRRSERSETYRQPRNATLSSEKNEPLRRENDDSSWRRDTPSTEGKGKVEDTSSDSKNENETTITEEFEANCGLGEGGEEKKYRTPNRRSNSSRTSLNSSYGSRKIFNTISTEESQSFLSYLKSEEAEKFTRVQEVEKDLFEVGEDYALAHCVAQDMNMGSGIAVEFRSRFNKVPELLDQRASPGGLAFLEIKGRFIYYLVTKHYSNGKPTYETLWLSLCELRTHIKDDEVKKLAMPRIGCGLDRLDWNVVKPMLEFLFKDEDLDILVCNFQPVTGGTPTSLKKCKIFYEQKAITEIEPETIIIYFASKDGKPTDTMKILDNKFKILPDFEKAGKDLGQTIRSQPMFTKNYILYGCIVKDNYEDDEFSFVAFANCLRSITKNYKTDNLFYIAFQKEPNDFLNAKILSLMKYNLRDMDIYVCGWTETPSIVEE